jgi:hypothetical protein
MKEATHDGARLLQNVAGLAISGTGECTKLAKELICKKEGHVQMCISVKAATCAHFVIMAAPTPGGNALDPDGRRLHAPNRVTGSPAIDSPQAMGQAGSML